MWMNRDEILEHLACSHRSLTRKVRAGNIESKADPNHRSRRLYRAITPSTIIRRSPSQLPPAASSTPSPNLVNELAEIKEQLTSVLAEVATLRALLMASKANPLSLDDRTKPKKKTNAKREAKALVDALRSPPKTVKNTSKIRQSEGQTSQVR